MNQPLTHLIFLAGLGQATILIASALVPWILRLCCGVLGHSAWSAGGLRYQRILEYLVGQSGLLRVGAAVQRFNDCLLMGRVAPG